MADELEARRGDPFVLEVNGRRFSGWVEVKIVRTMNAASGAWTVELFPTPGSPFPIRPGHEVEAFLGDEQLLRGYVDGFEASIQEKTTRSIQISGRDRSADLVDCSQVEPLEFLGLPIDQLATELARPFGVRVTLRSGRSDVREPFPEFKINPGESAWSALERACRFRARVCSPDGRGNLVLEDPASGSAEVELAEGKNLWQIELRWSDASRFRDYLVRGQRPGDDFGWGAVVAQVEGRATDPGIGRFRELLVIAEGALSLEDANLRAQWESTNRAARASRLVVEVPHWRQRNAPGSRLWRPNEVVSVHVPSFQIGHKLMLIERVDLSRSIRSGELAALTLVRRDSYVPQPELPPEEDPFEGLVDEELADYES